MDIAVQGVSLAWEVPVTAVAVNVNPVAVALPEGMLSL
jgi:hypothetical protein